MQADHPKLIQLQCDETQQRLIQTISHYYEAKKGDNCNILLYGGAGVGKTFVMNEVIKKIEAGKKIKVFVHHCSNLITNSNERLQLEQKIKIKQKFVLFLDEIDVLYYEKAKSQIQQSINIIKSLLSAEFNQFVMVIGLTNRPKRLSKPICERFQHHIYLGLPNIQTRLKVSKQQFSMTDNELTEKEILQFCEVTQGYTISDLLVVIKEASMSSLKRLFQCKLYKMVDGKYHPCQNGEVGEVLDIRSIPYEKIFFQPLTFSGLIKAHQVIKPSVTAQQIQDFREIL